jgi:probable HAF family extracellular repeat protein
MKSILTCITVSSLFMATAIAQPPRYTVYDLGVLPGGASSSANYLGDSRLIAGNAADAHGTQQAVFWWGPFMMNMGTPGLNSGIFGVNSGVQASVQTEISTKDPNHENFCGYGTDLECVAALYYRSVLTPLPTLGGNNATVGNINSKGEIAGAAETSTRDPDCPPTPLPGGTGPLVLDYEAAVWGPKPGDVRELKPLTGDTVGIALWINDRSQAVGASGTCANSALPPVAYGAHAVLWDADGTAHDLGNLGSTVINMALSINNQGQVAGVSALNDHAMPGNGTHAFLWTSQTGMRDLGAVSDDAASVGTMINDAGDVVGVSFDSGGNPRAFLWHDGTMSDLNDLAVGTPPLYLLFSTAINAHGEISGFGVTEKGDLHGFLAVPISDFEAHDSAPAARPVLSGDARKLLYRLVGR